MKAIYYEHLESYTCIIYATGVFLNKTQLIIFHKYVPAQLTKQSVSIPHEYSALTQTRLAFAIIAYHISYRCTLLSRLDFGARCVRVVSQVYR